MLEERRIRCRVWPGLFRHEYVVSIDTVNGGKPRPVEFVSDRSRVDVQTDPTDERPAEGRVAVWLLGESGNMLHVLVAASAASESMKVNVPKELALS